MGKDFAALDENHRAFIARQHMFFTATATAGARINISPRATTWFRILGNSAVAYLDLTGSGNETAAHTLADGRMTIMFCALEGPPLILRLYGKGRAIARTSGEYAVLLTEHFGAEPLAARQIVRLDFDLVKTSCGYGVPLYSHEGERDQLDRWAASKGADGLADYRRRKNRLSIDGLPTGLEE